MKTKILLLLLFALSLSALAQDYGQSKNIIIWDNETAPHSNNLTGDQVEFRKNRLTNVTEAQLMLFPADKQDATGQAVVICPGGAYAHLAMDSEGFLMAQWFAENGVTAAVLKYRMPNENCNVPLEDAVEGLRLLRAESEEYGFDKNKVGIVGCSAGGHLAASVSTIPSEEQRPDFTVLFYPVISSDTAIMHKGTFARLLGENSSQELRDSYSPEKRVSETTPPAFLVLSDDDSGVPPLNSILYYSALKKFSIKASIHIYPSGKHGWGAYPTFKYKDDWGRSLGDWLSTLE